MDDKPDWDDVVAKLARKTKQGLVDWERAKLRTPAGEKQGIIYVAEVLGKRVAVYEYESRYWTDEDEFHWQSDVSIEFIDNEDRTEWRFPQTQGRWDLIDAIRYREAGAADFLRNFFEDE